MEQERMRAEEEEEAHQEKDPFRNYIQLHLQRLEYSGEGLRLRSVWTSGGKVLFHLPEKGMRNTDEDSVWRLTGQQISLSFFFLH